MEMTERQEAILVFLKRRHAEGLPPPTIREIGEECDITSTSVVSNNVDCLVQAGLVVRYRDSARGIMLKGETGVVSPAQLAAENEQLRRKLKATEMQVTALRRQVAALQVVKGRAA